MIMPLSVKKTIMYLDARKSTLSGPIGFFEAFYKKNKLEEIKDQFIGQVPDLNDQDDYFAGKCSYVSDDKLEFHLELSEDEYDDEGNIIGFKNFTAELTFRQQLDQYLFNEYL